MGDDYMVQTFDAVIKKHEGIDGAYIEIPFDVEQVFETKRVKVKAVFDGVEYRGSIVKMGGCYMIGMTQALRKEIGKAPGDIVNVKVEKDDEERVIELPDDFKFMLEQNPLAKEYYEKLSYSNKREYYQWITGAKKEETRKDRIKKAAEMLAEGKKLK
jgi:hypothetical protein